jgi:hypothetical protein
MRVDMVQDAVMSMRSVAEVLAKDGRAFNKQLVEQCGKEWQALKNSGHSDAESGLHKDHLVFLRSIAQGFGWLHQTEKGRSALVSSCYDLLLVAAKRPFDANGEHEPLVDQSVEVGAALDRLVDQPRRRTGIEAGLKAWTAVAAKLPQRNEGEQLDLEAVQRLVLPIGGPRWTSLIPMKFYSLLHEDRTVPRTILPPLGAAVLRGVRKLYGLGLNEVKRDAERGMEIHLHLADLANASIYDINSGLYKLGGRS